RDLAVVSHVLAEVHCCHAAGAELAIDPVAIRDGGAQAVVHTGHGPKMGGAGRVREDGGGAPGAPGRSRLVSRPTTLATRQSGALRPRRRQSSVEPTGSRASGA